MLYSYTTKNLIGLQDVILKNVEQDAYGYRNFERFRKRILHIFRYKSKKAKTNAVA